MFFIVLTGVDILLLCVSRQSLRIGLLFSLRYACFNFTRKRVNYLSNFLRKKGKVREKDKKKKDRKTKRQKKRTKDQNRNKAKQLC